MAPSFRASPSSSLQPQNVAAHYSSRQAKNPRLQMGPASLARQRYLNIRAPTRFTARVWGWRHASADIRSSTGLAPRRGTDCVLSTTAWRMSIGYAGPDRQTDFEVLSQAPAERGRRCCCETWSCTASLFDSMQPADMQLSGDEPLLLLSYSTASKQASSVDRLVLSHI